MTVEQYQILETKHKNSCAICTNPCEQHKRLSIDHCHITGTIRGLLCTRCNKAFGFFEKSPSTLENLIKYARKAKEILVTKTEEIEDA